MKGKEISARGPYVWLLLGSLFVMPCCQKHSNQITVPKPPVILQDDVALSRAEAIRANVAAEVDSTLILSLWASDSLLADPVALDMDNYGRAFVTRTNRRRTSEFDIRNHKDWELASISFKDVEDRRAFLHNTLTPETGKILGKPIDLNGDGVQDWHDLLVESEEAYRIEDKNGDGIADFSQLVASGFHEEVTDIAGAILSTDENLFFGVAPDLWRLKDVNGDGVMDEKESISHGFQVHIGFGGHNLSGLIMGPDGRLYWGIGDIGFHGIDQTGKEWSYPNEGVIVRCNPDGSDFEVFAHGLRNTHEFVFDQYGNIISVDNDGDHPGESERMVYIVNGSDAGWRINWQFGKYNDPENNDYKVWMDEGMYKPRFEGQTASIVPCIRNYVNGPTGMVFNPGTALGKEWLDHFFVVEFNGNPARSGIHAFKLAPEGAGFSFAGDRKILSGVLATGLDVGADGALYFTDWIDGWEKKGFGRIWKLDVKNPSLSEDREETKQLLAMDFKTQEVQQLSQWLAHVDMRVRQKAQFALVDRDASAVLQDVAQSTDHQLARVHALWGLTQLVRSGKVKGSILMPFLMDSDAEIRAQACKLLGDVRWAEAGTELISLLSDPDARVRFFSAEALGRMAEQRAVQPIIEMLEKNDDQDAYLRHAGCLALARIGLVKPVVDLSNHPSRALRIAAVVTLRKLEDPSLATFLHDDDEFIVTEAARAINDDLSVKEALPELGKMLSQSRFENEALIRRAINADLRVGTKESMQLLIDFSLDNNRDLPMRLEAMMALGTWIRPSVVDRVDGRYRGKIERDPEDVREAAALSLPMLLKDPDTSIRIQAMRTLAKLGVRDISGAIADAMTNDPDAGVRSAGLEAMVVLDPLQAATAIKSILTREEEPVRVTALQQLNVLNIDASEIGTSLNNILTSGTSAEKQAALAALVNLPKESIVDQLSLMLDQLIAGNVNGALQLDLLEVAANNGDESVLEKIEIFRKKYTDLGVVANYVECLEGGDPRAGRRVLINNSAAQCLKCHAISGYGGVAGPPLDAVGSKRDRLFVLQSLVDPSAHLAPGYGVVTALLKNDQAVSGILLSEDSESLLIKDSKGQDIKVNQSEIKERINALSSMPPMGDILSKKEIRNLIAFLMTLKGEEL